MGSLHLILKISGRLKNENILYLGWVFTKILGSLQRIVLFPYPMTYTHRNEYAREYVQNLSYVYEII